MNRALILIRGLPGSGKSTLARRLTKSLGVVHFEADQFFVDASGKYNFDLSRLGEAHRWCQSETRRCLESNFTVVVSNTFTTIKELRPYFDIARELDIVPQVIACENQFGNIHQVPEETLVRMRSRWASDISELFQKD